MEKLENCVGSIICARCVKPRRQKWKEWFEKKLVKSSNQCHPSHAIILLTNWRGVGEGLLTRLKGLGALAKSPIFSSCRICFLTHAKEKASANAKYEGVGRACERSEPNKEYRPHPLPCQIFRFELASSYLGILPVRSTIEQKYEEIEGCEQSIQAGAGALWLVIWDVFCALQQEASSSGCFSPPTVKGELLG